MDRPNLRPRRIIIAIVAFAAMLTSVPLTTASAQEVPPANPIDLPCATNMSAQVLGSTPVGDGTQSLVSVRVIFGPGGSLGAHTHPGTLVATIESGNLGFTLLEDSEMSIKRAATADVASTEEALISNEEVSLNPGDGFVEVGMVHSAQNLADQPATVLLAGLIETGQPLTSCVDAASTAP